MQYHDLKAHLLSRYDAVGRQSGFRAETEAEHAVWKRATVETLRALTGLDYAPGMQTPPARLAETATFPGYTREKLLIETAPGVIMPTYRLVPEGLRAGERRPIVIAPHGHGSHGKDAVAGNLRNAAIAATVAEHNYDDGVQFVREGFIVFCPDACGFGERRETQKQGDDPEKMLDSSCALINHMALPLGKTVTGLWVYDLMRLIDYIERQPYAGAIGCAGLSGGGLQTLWLGVFDERPACFVVSGYFYGVRQSLLMMNHNCSCNYVPGLWSHVDMGDLGALVAPKPLLIVTGDVDPLNGRDGLDNVRPQVAVARAAFDLYGAGGRLGHHVFHGPHRWEGEQAIPFLKAHLHAL